MYYLSIYDVVYFFRKSYRESNEAVPFCGVSEGSMRLSAGSVPSLRPIADPLYSYHYM